MKRIILASLIAIAIGCLSSYFLFHWMDSISTAPQIKTTIDGRQIVKLVFINLIYFFALISLPFLSGRIIQRFRLTPKNAWKAVLAFEIFSLAFAIVATPPDIISTVLLFFLCQLIVLVNTIALRKKLKVQTREF